MEFEPMSHAYVEQVPFQPVACTEKAALAELAAQWLGLDFKTLLFDFSLGWSSYRQEEESRFHQRRGGTPAWGNKTN